LLGSGACPVLDAGFTGTTPYVRTQTSYEHPSCKSSGLFHATDKM
jgi:hypothetical protein